VNYYELKDPIADMKAFVGVLLILCVEPQWPRFGLVLSGILT